MMFDVLIKGGRVVTESRILKADVAVLDGKVAALLSPREEVKAHQVIDAQGKHVLPGVIDVHVHAGHGNPERETFEHASCAAAAGGITTMLEQPLSAPPTANRQAFEKKKAQATEQSIIDFGLWGGLIPDNHHHLDALYDAGAQAVKAFMCRSSNYPMSDDGALFAGMQVMAKRGGLVAVHAENDGLIEYLTAQAEAKGLKGVTAYIYSRQPIVELEAIERFIFLARHSPGCKAHVVHLSIPEGARVIKKAKDAGVDITVETCPQYLSLNEEDLHRLGPVAKCDPPVRPQAYLEELWEQVLDGTIDMVASDHAPHPWASKMGTIDEFDKADFGVTGLQTMLPILLTEGVHKRGMSLPRLVQITSLNPARRFGLYPQKGVLDIGSDADFILLDLEKEWMCQHQDMLYLNKHTAYHGRKFKGYVEKTFVRGCLVYDTPDIKVAPGFGRFVPQKIGT